MYTLIDPPESATRLGCWSKPLGRYSEIVGYSHLGSLFLKDPGKSEYLVLHPLLSGMNAKSYGFFASTNTFADVVLKDAAFVE